MCDQDMSYDTAQTIVPEVVATIKDRRAHLRWSYCRLVEPGMIKLVDAGQNSLNGIPLAFFGHR